MKKTFLAVCFLLALTAANAQHPENWFTDLDSATSYASRKHVPILMVFAGSDWCKPCIQFKRSILIHETFQDYARNHLAILYLDFPQKKVNQLAPEQIRHNERLAEKYNKSGAFPNVLLLDSTEHLLGTLSFRNQSPEEFIESCNEMSK